MTTRLRSDAQRNLERVTAAAAAAFAEHGPDVSVDEIARRAGVGHATVFRRFPTKEALLETVVRERHEQLSALADDALAAEDAGAAFVDFLWSAAALHARARGLHECLLRCAHTEEGERLGRAVERVVARAQEAGAVRGDVRPGDVPSLVRAALKAAPEGEWRRYVQVVLDGLRPPARSTG